MFCLTFILLVIPISMDTIDQDDLAGQLVAFDTSMENYTVPVSGKCILTCYVAEVRSFKVLWQKIDRTNQGRNETTSEQLTLIAFDGIVYSNKDHYRLESDYVGSYNLIIDRVNEDDQGEYQCQINTEPRKTKRIFLTVQVPPRIIDFRPNPPLFSIRTGAPLTLLCRAEGTPSPRIRWRVRDLDADRSDLSPPDNSNIWFIPSISHTFPRTVECIADNGVLPASNRIFTINIEYPPVVLISDDLIQTRLNENVTLECSVSSRPLARIFWEKNGKIIEENPLTTRSINQTMSRNRLQIQMNNDDDFGQYNCIAENIHGRMEAMIFVLKESIVLSTLTTKKSHRYPKKKFDFTRKYSPATMMNIYHEREISISSSSHRWTLNLKNLFFLLWLLFFPLRRRRREVL